MATQTVELQYLTGLHRRIFRNARLRGSWSANGHYATDWTELPMQEVVGEDGCPMFRASVALDRADQQRTFRWGVVLDGPQGSNFWGIPTEVHDVDSVERYREFRLTGGATQLERYYFTFGRRLGANKHFTPGNPVPGLRFSVWAPNAQSVDVVFGDPSRGYIADNGTGIDVTKPVVTLIRSRGGIWEGWSQGTFEAFKSLPYMYRIVNAQGHTVYRTDIFSRSQIGRGATNPNVDAWPGTVETLDGTVSCSVVIDPDVVRRGFASTPANAQPDLIPAEEFWSTEFTPGVPVPTRVADLIVYELHVGSLGFGNASSGDLSDAIAFLDHLVDLGVNAVELLPMAEFSGNMSWGYGDTHHFCIESSAGGRDRYRHFVRECHRRGIAVIQDVVYNHYDHKAERAQSQYDSTAPNENIYYWYKGHRRTTRHRTAATSTTDRRGERRDSGKTSCASNSSAAPPSWSKKCTSTASGRSDTGDASRQLAARQRAHDRQRESVRAEAAARVEPDASHDPANGHAHRRRPHGMERSHETAGSRRAWIRRDMGGCVLSQPRRRFRDGG